MYIYNNNTFIIYSQPLAPPFRSHHIRSAFGKFNFMFDGAAQTITADLTATRLFVAAGYSANLSANSDQILAQPAAEHFHFHPAVYTLLRLVSMWPHSHALSTHSSRQIRLRRCMWWAEHETFIELLLSASARKLFLLKWLLLASREMTIAG